jgi:hypothetical protein
MMTKKKKADEVKTKSRKSNFKPRKVDSMSAFVTEKEHFVAVTRQVHSRKEQKLRHFDLERKKNRFFCDPARKKKDPAK